MILKQKTKMNPVLNNTESWLDRQVTLFKTCRELTGQPATYRAIIYWLFGEHIDTIVAIRKLDQGASDHNTRKAELKKTLAAFCSGALVNTRKAGEQKAVHLTGMAQLDWDDLREYDPEEVKQAIFSLPFVGLCSLSVSGNGVYALIEIAEPERMAEYAERCFKVFTDYGLPPDTTKGRNPLDLRFVSYDANMLVRDHPKPLRLPKREKKVIYQPRHHSVKPDGHGYLNKALYALSTVQKGNRWGVVQQVGYTLGGYSRSEYLDAINQAIINNPAFAGQEEKYLKCAKDQFKAGAEKPFKIYSNESANTNQRAV